MPSLVTAETGTMTASRRPDPPATIPYSVRSCLIRSGLADGLSILLIAMTIGTSAACAWLIASTVCGMIPSSAATVVRRCP